LTLNGACGPKTKAEDSSTSLAGTFFPLLLYSLEKATNDAADEVFCLGFGVKIVASHCKILV